MGEDYFNEEERLLIKKIEKFKTNALALWGGAASGVALCLAFSKIADKNTGDKALFDIFMLFCVFCQAGAMVCGGASIYSLIKMLGYKKKYQWLKETEENVSKGDKSNK